MCCHTNPPFKLTCCYTTSEIKVPVILFIVSELNNHRICLENCQVGMFEAMLVSKSVDVFGALLFPFAFTWLKISGKLFLL